MKSVILLGVLAVTCCSVISAGQVMPWQLKMKLRNIHSEIGEMLQDMMDYECMDREGSMKDLKQRVNRAQKVLQILKQEEKKCKAWIKKSKPKVDTDPCKQHLKLGFNDTLDDNGDMYLGVKVISNTSVRECNPRHTWLKLQDLEYGDEGSEDLLIKQCPPVAGCGGHLTRYWTADDVPRQPGQSGNVTFQMNFASNCTAFNGANVTMEIKVCEDRSSVYRLPAAACGIKKICDHPWQSDDERMDD